LAGFYPLSSFEGNNEGQTAPFPAYPAVCLYPAVTFSAHAVFQPIPAISFIPSLQYVGNRWSDSSGESELDGYLLLNLKAVYEVNSHLSISAAVENVFDTLYEIRPYFPQAGRGYTLSLEAKW
jgi:outer membrane receptor protein involved in Fe transport